MGTLRSAIDYCMLHENDLRMAIYEKKNDSNTQGCGRKSGISKPTENKALFNLNVGKVLVNNLVVVEYPEKMVDIISYTKAHFNKEDKYGSFYRSRYILKEDYIETCKNISISTSTYYNYLNTILDYAENIAGKVL